MQKEIRIYYLYKKIGDHEHCKFCSEKITDFSDDVNDAYYSVNTKYTYWICPECYEEFKDIFQWFLL